MAALVLSLVLAVVWALFVALGYWHGGWREVVALAGILLSSAVLAEWAGPNGRDLSAAFGWGLTRTVTGVALAYLIGGAAILGYLGSMLLPRPYPLPSRERLLGALVGVLNGGLLLALALRILRAYAFAPGRGAALHDSALARFLIEEVGYVLIAAFGVGIGAVIAGVVLSLRRTAAEAAPEPEGYTAPLPATAPTQPGALPVPAAAAVATMPGATLGTVSAANGDPYTAAPVIDWPAAPPPGMPVAATAAAGAVTTTPRAPSSGPARGVVPPTEPRVPPRVPPPMWYPVETLLAGTAKERPAAASAPQPVPQTAESPAVPVIAATAVLSTSPARPTMPPPGAPVPASSANLPAPAAESAATEEPVVVRELDVATRESQPMTPVAASEAGTLTEVQTPRPAEETMQPEMPPTAAIEAAAPEAPAAPEEPTSLPEHEAAAVAQPSREEASATATAAFPTVTPPPLPPMPRPVAAPPDAPRPRGTYARVAQPRQMAGQPPQPAPHPPRQPEEEQPLRPPVPTGPDVRPCPTCGYPVRSHARYCPNCGHRLPR